MNSPVDNRMVGPVDSARPGLPPTQTRLVIAGLLTCVSCLLYLDRFAVGIASERIETDLHMTKLEVSWFLSAFFWSYALAQVPAGWLSDRFGRRAMLTAYILFWSLFTGLLGLAGFVWQVLLLRFLCGVSQAGAYPICSSMIRVWFPVSRRGAASSVVAMGGRAGAVLAPVLTAALMTLLPGAWRGALVVYGLAGIGVAAVFYLISRNSPQQHPWCNAQERLLIAHNPNQSALDEPERPPFPWRPVLTSVSLWGNSLTQLFTNIGWLFVTMHLPTYLADIHKVPLGKQSVMTAFPAAAGMVGMLMGGSWTDYAARKFGLKWGRRLPAVSTRLVAAAGYGICLTAGLMFVPSASNTWLPWVMVFGLSLASWSCDLGVPAIWAYAQDVGGKYTASILGWANMFGNFGAALAPLIYGAALGEKPKAAEWNAVFAICGAAFIVSAGSAMFLNATKQIRVEVDSSPSGH